MIELFILVLYVIFAFPLIRNILRDRNQIASGTIKWKFSVSLLVFGWVGLTIFIWALSLYIDILWFDELGQKSRFFSVLKSKAVLAILGAMIAFATTLGVGMLARHLICKKQNISKNLRSNMLAVTIVSSVVAGLIFSVAFVSNWSTIMLYLNAEPFNIDDPVFGKDVSFYVFTLPFLKFIGNAMFWLLLLQIIQIVWFAYWIGRDDLTDGRLMNTTARKTIASTSTLIAAVLGFFALTLAFLRNLSPYHYLFSDKGIFYGANYVDTSYKIGANGILVFILVVFAAIFFFVSAGGLKLIKDTKKRVYVYLAPAVAFAGFWLFAIVIFPAIVQNVAWPNVSKNEFNYERQHIQWNIEYTRMAYGLDNVVVREINPALSLGDSTGRNPRINPQDILDETATLRNIRIADVRVLLNTFNQRQALRRYYEFAEVYEARYFVNGEYRQVMITVRELNQDLLDSNAKTWINLRFKFTHGYGVVMVPVNEFLAGLPVFLLKDIPVESFVREIEITRPEIYFGRRTNAIVIINTAEDEFSHPTESGEITTTRYEGGAGIEIGSKFSLRRLALAIHYDGIGLYTSQALNPDSRILITRNIMERVQRLAPFLEYEEDPYPVVTEDGRIMWVLDAYTTSAGFPYSSPNSGINYIRNSVKVTIDAYDGTVKFYVFDEDDPIIRAWRNVFPEMFISADEMPPDIFAQIRYPKRMFIAQAQIYTLYHMEDAEIFYKREDVYAFAREKYHDQALGFNNELRIFVDRTVVVQPYYTIMRLPEEENQEFVLGVPFTPKGQEGRERLQLIAWMTARSDGDNYGQIIVYRLPSHRLTPGPQQIEALIDSDDEISAQINLWNRGGSSVIRGNLITVPIANTILSVEPIYIQADINSIPLLQRVIVSIGEYVAWGRTLDEALHNLFVKMGADSISLGEQGDDGPISDEAARLVEQAITHFDRYLAFQAEGKFVEAARELEKHYSVLRQLKELLDKEEKEQGESP